LLLALDNISAPVLIGL